MTRIIFAIIRDAANQACLVVWTEGLSPVLRGVAWTLLVVLVALCPVTWLVFVLCIALRILMVCGAAGYSMAEVITCWFTNTDPLDPEEEAVRRAAAGASRPVAQDFIRKLQKTREKEKVAAAVNQTSTGPDVPPLPIDSLPIKLGDVLEGINRALALAVQNAQEAAKARAEAPTQRIPAEPAPPKGPQS